MDSLGDLGRSIFGPDKPVKRDDGVVPQPQPRWVQNDVPVQQSPALPPPPSGAAGSTLAPRCCGRRPAGRIADGPPRPPNLPDSRFPRRQSRCPRWCGLPREITGRTILRTTRLARLGWCAEDHAKRRSTPADSASPEQPMYQRLQNSRRSAFNGSSPGQAVADSVFEPPATPARIAPPRRATAKGRLWRRRALQPLRRRAVPMPTVGSGAPALPDSGPAGKDVVVPPALIAPAKAAKSEPAAEANANLLFAHKSPVLSVETKGPRHIAIGKEAAYEVTIQNAGDVVADEVVVFIGLPAWADIAGAEASAGARGPPRAAAPPSPSNGTSAAWRRNRGRSWCYGSCRARVAPSIWPSAGTISRSPRGP